MDSTTLSNSFNRLGRSLQANSPTILTGLAVAGLVSTVILAIKATPKALEAIEMEEKYRSSEIKDPQYGRPIEYLDILKLTWRFYIPTMATGLATTTCIIGANSIHLRRTAALASLFSITETALKEYQAKVVEQIGEKKEELIRNEIAQDTIEKNPPSEKTIIMTGRGNILCLDKLSGRYFYSDVEKIRQCQNDFNYRLMSEYSITLNEFYADIGMEPIDMGSQMGWTIEKGQMNIYFTSGLTPDKIPCVVIEHKNMPVNLWG